MLNITNVTIRGFQSHVDSGFKLAPGLTVITGPSDAGKTAVIRALRWLAFNEPQGDSFLHTLYNPDGSVNTQAEQAEVIVEMDNGAVITKTRRKGKTTYTHSLYPEPWEKAEVPPEIKEALGLTKQSYGDFETCLNFAFQLDPPFLLSETGSVGAKVLGKLAGTEVVDKAIGAVNKLMHRTRTDLAQAEKTVGQLDVELLEYLQVDTQYSELETLETVFANTEKLVIKQKALVELNNQYTALTDRKRALHDTLEPLECVPRLVSSLRTTSYYEDKRGAIGKLATDFWRNVETCRISRQTLRKLEDVKPLLLKINKLADLDTLIRNIGHLMLEHLHHVKQISDLKKSIAQSDEVLQQKKRLYLLSDNLEMLNDLQTLVERHRIATDSRNSLTGRITALEATTVLRGKIEGLQAIAERHFKLSNIESTYATKREEVEVIGEKVGILRFEILTTNGELQEAWEEAGGVCPLCGQAIERGATECTH